MRCLACGEEMRVVEVVPDDTMPVPGYGHRTLECPGCHEVERRLQFAPEVEPVEPPALPSKPDQDQSLAAPGTVAARAVIAERAQTTWERALDRLHSQQSYLQERQAEAKAAEAVGRFHQDWENLARDRRQSDAIVAPPAPAASPVAKISKLSKPFSVSKFTNVSTSADICKSANVSKSADASKSFKGPTIPTLSVRAAVRDARAPLRTAPSSAMARAIARLHKHTAVLKPIDRSSEDSKRFDELWESLAPRPQRPTPAPSPQPVSQSRSLVPVKELEASSAWARAMLMLRARQ